MSIESIMNQLRKSRPELAKGEVRAVATDLYYSGEPATELVANNSLIDKLVSGYQSRQSGIEGRVAANDPHSCPICKLPLKPVTLINDREAVICAKHFVVYPVKKEDTGGQD
jgi:hypothetical protein